MVELIKVVLRFESVCPRRLFRPLAFRVPWPLVLAQNMDRLLWAFWPDLEISLFRREDLSKHSLASVGSPAMVLSHLASHFFAELYCLKIRLQVQKLLAKQHRGELPVIMGVPIATPRQP